MKTAPVLPTAAAVEQSAFRNVMGHFLTGVAVITCNVDGKDVGMTASAVSSVSLDPPTLLVCLNLDTATQRAVQNRGAFAVNILHDDQGDIARLFATYGADKFNGLSVTHGELGQPMLDDALATIECTVISEAESGTHRVFVAHAAHAEARQGEPLAYYRGQFGHLMHANELEVFETVRARVLEGDPVLQRDLTPSRLAELLEVPFSAAYFALNRLVTVGVLEVREGAFHALTRPMALHDSRFDARLAVELGAVALIAEHLSSDAIDELRERLERVRQSLSYDLSSPRQEVEHDAFHAHLVSLSRNEMLLDAYRRVMTVRVPAIDLIAHGEVDDLLETYEQIIDGLARREAGEVRAALTNHYRMRKLIARRAIRGTYFLS